jgi:hypothetical protein
MPMRPVGPKSGRPARRKRSTWRFKAVGLMELSPGARSTGGYSAGGFLCRQWQAGLDFKNPLLRAFFFARRE